MNPGGKALKVTVGDTVTIPCKIHNKGKWKNPKKEFPRFGLFNLLTVYYVCLLYVYDYVLHALIKAVIPEFQA